MGRYEIKRKNKGKSTEFGVVAPEATRCTGNSGILVIPGETGETSEE